MRYASLVLGFLVLAETGPAQAQLAEIATEVVTEIVANVGTQLISDAIKGLWNSDVPADQRVDELKLRLSSYELGLRQVAATTSSNDRRMTDYESGLKDTAKKLADQVAALSKTLDSKTSYEEVRGIVDQTLKELNDRTRKIKSDLDLIEPRVRTLMELFGNYLPTVTPAPLITTKVNGVEKPTAHPLMVEWLPLLVASERSRYRVEELGQTLPPTSKRLKAEQAKDHEFIEQAVRLNKKVLAELAAKLPDRQSLLEEHFPSDPEVKNFDMSLATLTWLAAVTRPVPTGPYKGRLAVPNQLFGFDAPELLYAFQVAGVNSNELIELYRQHFLAVASANLSLTLSVQQSKLSPAMLKVSEPIVKLAARGIDLTKKVPDIEARLSKARSEYSEFSTQVTTIRNEQSELLKQIRAVHTDLKAAFNQAFELYLTALKDERPTNSRMTAFRQGVLLPTIAWLNWLAPREDSEFDATSWQRYLVHRWDRAVTCDRGVAFEGHTSVVTSIGFSPDGSRIASGSRDNTIKIWDVASGKAVATLVGHTDSVFSVTFSPDSSRIASGSRANTIKIWDGASGKVVATLAGHTNSVNSVAFSPDGTRIASASWDKTVRVWDLTEIMIRPIAEDHH